MSETPGKASGNYTTRAAAMTRFTPLRIFPN
jgi:hypothetical protein